MAEENAARAGQSKEYVMSIVTTHPRATGLSTHRTVLLLLAKIRRAVNGWVAIYIARHEHRAMTWAMHMMNERQLGASACVVTQITSQRVGVMSKTKAHSQRSHASDGNVPPINNPAKTMEKTMSPPATPASRCHWRPLQSPHWAGSKPPRPSR
ncbi:hypothetical protein SE91_12230 [Bradyrhizobium sp. DOA1]|nr:hypothetical protein SE91_12230 [Bradyrhizobium sp. DOA1]